MAAVLALGLAGCLPLPGAQSGAKSDAAPIAEAKLASGAITVSGPEGYCIDPKTLDTGGSRDFALIASCMSLSDGEVGYFVEPVLITVTVGPAGPDAALPSAQGFAAAAGAELLDEGDERGLILANLSSGGDGPEGVAARHWRGAFLLKNRLVLLALYAPEGSDYVGARGGRMLGRVRDQIVVLSSARGDSAPAPEASPATAEKKPGGLFGRLFNPKDL
ncbi:dihydroxy-acid dehydratase [Pacificoceanicola onchidii]|uniref:dihydroxy-acid dehydratase n=1 Tax=Pacificoceanicola onchidii TaxID=2562685 RepID=UPI00197F81F8|nr:dihydroxy-acid dehydratase [Pacificoceanicola onchidii]